MKPLIDDDRHPRVFTLKEMLAEMIYITEGNKVLLRHEPTRVMRFRQFEMLTAASRIEVAVVGRHRRSHSVASAWRNHPERVTVQTLADAQLEALL